MEDQSIREQRIRKVTQLYYSKPEIQEAIFGFSENREVIPRYFEGFGKRPDSFQYKGDIFELVKKGATSFHCSEEIWSDPLKIFTGMNEIQSNKLRTGWDLLIDIDSRYIDYSKISAEIIMNMLGFHGVKNCGIKFSGSKGFHIIVPWKSFPKEINKIKTSDMFPEWPRIITHYIMEKTKKQLIEKITSLTNSSKYIKDFQASEEVMPDIILVSPRHLFRMPYSLHEKTALASVVLDAEEIASFQLKDANPLKVKVRNFMPDSKEDEASELLVQALDWHKQEIEPLSSLSKNTQYKESNKEFKPIKLSNISEKNFPPCVKKIFKGLTDGKKRALFILINLFRSVGMDKDELEKKIDDWNKRNNPPIKQGYINSQLSWSYRKKPIMPPNCKEFYKGIGVCLPDNFCTFIKNPVNYIIRKNFQANQLDKTYKKRDTFKNNN